VGRLSVKTCSKPS